MSCTAMQTPGILSFYIVAHLHQRKVMTQKYMHKKRAGD